MAGDQQPAQLTQLAREGSGFVPAVTAPDRGLDLRSGLVRASKDIARILKNLRWNGIAWTTENIGYTRHRAAAFNSGAAFKEFALHYTADGEPHFIQQVGTQVQQYNPLGDPDTEVEEVLFTAVSESIPCMRSFSETQFIYVNGVNVPQLWDGVSPAFVAMTGWPKVVGSDSYNTPKFVETFQGRAAYAGFHNKPFHILISEFNKPDGFDLVGTGLDDPARAGIVKIPSRYGPIVTLKSFRISAATNEEVLLVGCKRGFLFIGGTTAATFQTIQSSNRYGFVSNRCWLKLDDVAYCLCTDGIRPFSGNINTSALEGNTLTFPIRPVIKAMAKRDPNQIAQAFVIDNPDEQEAIWFFPSGSEVHNQTGIIMNYSDVAAGLLRLSLKVFPAETEDPETFHAPSCGIEYEGKLLCGGYNGYLQNHWDGNKLNTVGIDAQYLSPLFDAPTPSQSASARGFWIECDGPNQAFKVTAYYWPMMAAGNVERKQGVTKEFISNVDGTMIFDIDLDFDVFGGPQRQLATYDPSGSGHGWEMQLDCNTEKGDLSLVAIFGTLLGGGTRG